LFTQTLALDQSLLERYMHTSNLNDHFTLNTAWFYQIVRKE